ncbi:MAG: hypothetical protein EKK61_00125, partial [Rickettsiales bacterium]
MSNNLDSTVSDFKDVLRNLKESSDYTDFVAHMDTQNARFSQLEESTKLTSYYLLINNKIDLLYSALGNVIFERQPVSIETFVESPDYLGNVINRTLRPKWREDLYEFFKLGSSFKSAIFSGAIGTGKAQPLTSKIKTPTGWKLMGDIQVGDIVDDSKGGICSVTGVFPQGKKDIYKITFEDGRSTECCLEHLWEIYSWETENKELYSNHFEKDILNTKQLINKLSKNKEVYVPLYKTNTSEDIQTLEYFYDIGKSLSKIDISGDTSNLCFNLDAHQRISVLRGILDSLAIINENRYIDIISTNLGLIKVIQYLVRSLGGSCKIASHLNEDGSTSYKPCIKYHKQSNLFDLPQNKKKFKYEEVCDKLKIISIEYVRKDLAQCIMVDSKDHLYVTDDFIVTHNTTISRIMILYVLYRVLCLRNPQATFNLSVESRLNVALISITKDKAKNISFRPLVELILQCPAFEKVSSLNSLGKYKGHKIPFYVVDSEATVSFKNNIYITIASQLSHLVGYNTFAGFMDEAELSSSNAAETLETYSELTTRIYSRFKRSGFTFSSIVSSAGTSNGVVQQYIERVRDRINVDTTLYEYTLWELFPKVDPFANGSFWVLNGNNTTPSAIIEDPTPYLCGEKQIPINCELIQIPSEYYFTFKTDVVKNLRDIAGKVTNEADVPFPDVSTMRDRSLCPVVHIETDKNDLIPFFDRLPDSLFLKDFSGSKLLKRASRAKRYSHIDLAIVTGSTAAISVCHKEIGQGNSIMYVVDFIIKITTTDVIKIEKVYELFLDLKYKANIQFKTITADQYQST